ncbi:MAG: hypothetical protein GY842_14525, partial [bacterium]|nr:hypothetical protein [bacterium]
FVIRCHPRYDHPALYEWVNQSLPPEQKMLVCGERSLTDLVAWADVIVVPNVKTSAMFDVSFGGKPVYLLDQSMIWHDHNWWGTQHWPHAGSVAELERELGALFGDSQHYAMRAAQTRDALFHYLDGAPEPFAPRCARLIRDLAGETVDRRPARKACRTDIVTG